MVATPYPIEAAEIEAAGRPLGRRLTKRLGYATSYSLAVYLATRLAIFVGALAAYLNDKGLTWSSFARRRDGWWYLRIAQHGYGHTLHVQVPGIFSHFSTWAFFPGYPMLVRAVHEIVPAPISDEAFVLSFVIGALAVRAVYALGAAYGGVSVARGSALLVAAWPGSAAMNMAYSDGLFIAATAASLTMLLKRKWLWAGVLGMVATAARPAGMALIGAAFVAAVLAVRRSRDWKALVAPVLTSLGMLAFMLYGWAETGDFLIWRHAENLWHQRLDFSTRMFARWGPWFTERGGHAQQAVMELLGLILVVGFLAVAWSLRRRLNAVLATYAAIALFLILGFSGVGTRPRMLLAVLPGFVWLAARLRRRATEILGLGFASGLALVAYLYMTTVTP